MRQTAPLHRRQHGAIAIMFGLTVLGIMGVIGMALDLALVYNRKAELQALADATALAAASQLNGSATGVSNAVTQANITAGNLRYQYNKLPFSWAQAALSFSTAADAPDSAWISASAAQAAPAGVMFAKVDTGALNAVDSAIGTVATVFMRMLPNGARSVSMTARAVAGRASTNVLPLAICAQSATPAASRVNVSGNTAFNELVEYGFRRGVGYDLMRLNPHGTTPENFLVDPLSPPGIAGSAANFSTAVVGPFVCAGSMPMASVLGGMITVQRGFPLADLHDHLNSRMDRYENNACTPQGAPPDSNVKPYPTSDIPWMTTAPSVQTADEWTSGGTRLWTRADPLPGDASNTDLLYGPLWSYARAVPYSAYAASPNEPAAGYSGFAATAWANLYKPGPPVAKDYPSAPTTPYRAVTWVTFEAPAAARQPGQTGRRVLNVPLLECPVAAGGIVGARVLAVGRFFMTVAATDTHLSAEFAGTAPAASLGGAVELQR